MAAIRECGFELLSQPPYSPDLAPSDYHVFWSLKDSLRGQSFSCDEEVIHMINDWFELQDKQFFVNGVNSLAHWWEKRVVLEGDYIENRKVNLAIVICISDFLITYWPTLVQKIAKNGAITVSRTNFSKYVGHVTIFSNAYYCMLLSSWVRIWIKFSVRLVSGYAFMYLYYFPLSLSLSQTRPGQVSCQPEQLTRRFTYKPTHK